MEETEHKVIIHMPLDWESQKTGLQIRLSGHICSWWCAPTKTVRVPFQQKKK